jgi:PadR family transcriptional regulator PadR
MAAIPPLTEKRVCVTLKLAQAMREGLVMTYERELLKGNTDCLLLSLLEDEPTYGYQIIRELERRSNGYFRFKEGTLYPALHRLEKDKLIEGKWQVLPNGQERRYYYITRKGQEALSSKLATWQDFSKAVRSVLRTEMA